MYALFPLALRIQIIILIIQYSNHAKSTPNPKDRTLNCSLGSSYLLE